MSPTLRAPLWEGTRANAVEQFSQLLAYTSRIVLTTLAAQNLVGDVDLAAPSVVRLRCLHQSLPQESRSLATGWQPEP